MTVRDKSVADAAKIQQVIDVLEDRGPWYVNHYCHDDCPINPGTEWDDEWSCMCDDECPACGASIEPYNSTRIS